MESIEVARQVGCGPATVSLPAHCLAAVDAESRPSWDLVEDFTLKPLLWKTSQAMMRPHI
ncbi:hypothetical protein Bdiaspc4_18390 [Bradyrhizobium diazoefficiens]|nr:hypothetical protein AAV28_14820 [Bradyrhizobium diazoefficiens USDA 110]PDT62827.1 hypothetical protein CO678_00020 [Bradyrhizobium diazoefficiens]QBP22338.1 hypothetical protein Bdiaspc4_18390 [Bradyrhizobium diazoefficiens]